MNREEGYLLVREELGETATFFHCLATEACMRSLALLLREDKELWGLAGLVHDVDLARTEGEPARHTLLGAEMLRQRAAPEEIVQAVLGHNDKAPRDSRMAKALWVVDPTTGFIFAAALIRPSKSTSDLGVDSIKKRMKDKRFAAAVNRDQIRACTAELGIELDDFLQICRDAMHSIRAEIGL